MPTIRRIIMKISREQLKQQAVTVYRHVREWIVAHPVSFAREVRARAAADTRDRNRIVLILLSLLFFMDYLMFCYHIEKNILDIFPSIPLLEQKRSVTLHLPSVEKTELFKEEREIPVFDSDEKNVSFLFRLVTKGSIYENTSLSVPVNLRIRKIWIVEEEKRCIIDVDADTVPKGILVIKGSEALFRSAVEKTITQNVPSIKSVILLEKGVPERTLWEM